ncbi:sigma-54 interaction domain-containing protein [Aidingimonas halophila]|uniref:DNA-binding transcriptional response regulator, NtrC family, contains REC, AAA-type ATPase, and a Fis-type DNA-binding domains n=1 Tax=Aidingimonas halophila TaxID=574349 RepID=A0A1H2XNF7_9GAMM|nr:sigma-54 dependent transcriptional regulator [Aidingimonas halophila]GHC28982.1 sigma-54-dependent Fis family transcriptional regulator [Aidingimonas halophila]SDW94014.1 DNA-binding transcriptional response regulator, NtrC family, contains REC, AAA-type ATPase, and a Fis-type DNA-binding domains [Aidingimonas halophila]
MYALKRLLYIGDSAESNRLVMSKNILNTFDVIHHRHLVPASENIQPDKFDIGIVDLTSLRPSFHPFLETLIDKSHIEWIALANQEYLDKKINRLAIRSLFYAYHLLPGSSDKLHILLRHAATIKYVQNPQTSDLPLKCLPSDRLLINSLVPRMQHLVRSIRKVAMIQAPIMLLGESGTGKELIARTIHDMSARRHGPFIAINCGSLPSDLIQDELFGHEKGAFTDAHTSKPGRIESAHEGTLFLDEIGDLPHNLQVNLLRFLEDQKICRLGGVNEIRVDVRIISATHIDMMDAIYDKKFREDLYHRLNVIQLDIPPLRERKDDIETLVTTFFNDFSKEAAPCVKGFSSEALLSILQHDWPGNIRELINRVRRALVMCEGELIQPEDLGLTYENINDEIPNTTLDAVRDQAEIEVIKKSLERNKSNISATAKELNVSRVTLYRLLDKHRVDLCRKPVNGSKIF